ncbi:hypothetical protein BK025_09080 [Sodalis sp. TME1]|nr:hypothetical protein BK025_09080 [Sodalis sp. TME1]
MNKTNQISARRIAQILYERGWNKSELSRKLGVSVQAVQQWVGATSKPSGKNLTKLAEVSGKPEYWFFMEKDDNDSQVHQKPVAIGRALNPRQEKLLALFEQLPESEKEHMVNLFEEKVKEYDKLLKELIALKNNKI